MVPHLTRFEPLRVMAIFGTYLRAGRGSEPVWFRGPKTSPKVPVIYGATSGGPNPKLMMTLKKACLPPLKNCWDCIRGYVKHRRYCGDGIRGYVKHTRYCEDGIRGYVKRLRYCGMVLEAT